MAERPTPPAPESLEALLWRSRTLYVARLDGEGVIVAVNDALAAAAGRPLRGEPATVLVAGPQRPALARHVAAAGAGWTQITIGFWHGGPAPADDRLVHVRADADGVLLVAEPDADERDRLVEQVLRLNDDLIASQRDLGRRQRDVTRAQAAAETAEGRLRRLEAVVLAGFTSRSLDVALARLLVLAREALAGERAAVLLVEDPGRTLRVRAAIDMDIVGDVTPFGTGVSGTIAATGRGLIVDDIAQAPGLAPEHRRFRGSLAGVPLRLDGEVTGVLHVSTTEIGRFGAEDLRVLEAVGDRAALAIGHAQLRERERRIGETLQRTLLPRTLPAGAGLSLVARYFPRDVEGPVGGDFYDAVELPGGRLGLAIGDVAGKGLTAAAAMGQVRAALHAYALEDHEPARVLARLDRFVSAMDDITATAMFVVVDGGGDMVVASAGHPPAVIVDAGGAQLVRGALGPPLGAGIEDRRQERLRLAPQARLLLYTDGLVERRDEGLDVSLEALRSVAAGAPPHLDHLCDHVLTALEPDRGWPDDVALLAAGRGLSAPRPGDRAVGTGVPAGI